MSLYTPIKKKDSSFLELEVFNAFMFLFYLLSLVLKGNLIIHANLLYSISCFSFMSDTDGAGNGFGSI